MQTVTPKCKICRQPFVGPSQPKAGDILTCTGCGRKINYDVVLQETTESVGAAYAKQVEELLKKGSRGVGEGSLDRGLKDIFV